MKKLIDTLEQQHVLPKDAFIELLSQATPDVQSYAITKARDLCLRVFGQGVYIRGLIEFTNYCKNNCAYCGIRGQNTSAQRYRLTKDDIVGCAAAGYGFGFRTFVLQGGEDPFFTPDRLAEIVQALKKGYPDSAITLSVGEHEKEAYTLWKKAGADRFLLRHETATAEHYTQLHPDLLLERRLECLWNLKELGYQTGTGFMVGSPGQTAQHLAEDLLFLHHFQPQMVGIGPFLPHKDTPFAKEKAGTLEQTLFILALIRLMLPHSLIPSTTSLATVHPKGREQGLLAGANVLMPNLSPADTRSKYMLYDNKLCTNEEAAEEQSKLVQQLQTIHRHIVVGRGDFEGVLGNES